MIKQKTTSIMSINAIFLVDFGSPNDFNSIMPFLDFWDKDLVLGTASLDLEPADRILRFPAVFFLTGSLELNGLGAFELLAL